MELGERWGEVTQRLFKTAYNESAIYERNRERLFEIRDMKLRRLIHVHFLSETVPLMALLDKFQEISALEKEIASAGNIDPSRAADMQARMEVLKESREASLRGVQDEHAETESICQRLESLAGVTF